MHENVNLCKVCKGKSIYFGEVDFNKSGNDYFIGRRTFPPSNEIVTYYRCTACGYIFTTYFDNWKSEDYKERVYNSGYFKADPPFETERPHKLLNIIETLLGGKFKDETILDYGGGEGKLVELLRKAGFPNSESYDPLFSERRPNRAKYNIVTCFEVIEHVPNQQEFWNEIFSFLKDDGFMLFTTLVQPENIAQQGTDWWYICPRNGHVGFHTVESLKISIEGNAFRYQYINDQLHLAKPMAAKVVEISKINLPSIFSGRTGDASDRFP